MRIIATQCYSSSEQEKVYDSRAAEQMEAVCLEDKAGREESSRHHH